jgi:hypothetical protein
MSKYGTTVHPICRLEQQTKRHKVLSRFMQKWIQPLACYNHGLHRILSFYWLAHFYLIKNLLKCSSFWVRIAGRWNFLLTSRSPKNNWCISRIFGAQFIGKDPGLSTCKPWYKQVGGWIHFCMKGLRTSKSYQIFKTKNKNKKPKAFDVLFKAYLVVPLLCRSNLANDTFKSPKFIWAPCSQLYSLAATPQHRPPSRLEYEGAIGQPR